MHAELAYDRRAWAFAVAATLFGLSLIWLSVFEHGPGSGRLQRMLPPLGGAVANATAQEAAAAARTALALLAGAGASAPGAHRALHAAHLLAQRWPALARFGEVQRAFEAAPWLLPEGTPFPYAGLHNDLDALLAVRAQMVGRYEAVVLVLFNHQVSEMMQNSIYTMCRYGGVRSYILVTWDSPSLAACVAMGLPCLNATAFLPGAANGSDVGAAPAAEAESTWGSSSFLQITWIRPALAQAVLRRGFMLVLSDADISYTPGDLLGSYLAYMDEVGASVSMMSEGNSRDVNGGNVAMLPTPAGRRFARRWGGLRAAALREGIDDQVAMNRNQHRPRPIYDACGSAADCARRAAELRAAGTAGNVTVVRLYPSLLDTTFGWCSLNPSIGGKLARVEPCAATFPYFHPICVSGRDVKMMIFKTTGMWLMDDQDGGCLWTGAGSVPRCRPTAWRLPANATAFERCSPTRQLFVFGHKEYGDMARR
eukprot:scaffold9.g3233.t1